MNSNYEYKLCDIWKEIHFFSAGESLKNIRRISFRLSNPMLHNVKILLKCKNFVYLLNIDQKTRYRSDYKDNSEIRMDYRNKCDSII